MLCITVLHCACKDTHSSKLPIYCINDCDKTSTAVYTTTMGNMQNNEFTANSSSSAWFRQLTYAYVQFNAPLQMRQSFTAAHHGNYHRSTDYCYTVVLTHSKFNLVQWQFIIRLTSIVHGDWLKLGLGMCSRAACQFQLSW